MIGGVVWKWIFGRGKWKSVKGPMQKVIPIRFFSAGLKDLIVKNTNTVSVFDIEEKNR